MGEIRTLGQRISRSVGRRLGAMALACLTPLVGGRSAGAQSGSSGETPEWTLASAPEYSISESARPPSFQLHQVVGGAILSDGRAVIANGGSRNLVFVSEAGSPLRIVGRAGQGPGEFASLTGVLYMSDTVGIWDSQLGRVSLFGPSGDYLGASSFSGSASGIPFGLILGAKVVTLRAGSPMRPVPPGERRTYEVWEGGREPPQVLLGPPDLPPRVVRYLVQGNARTMGLGLPTACWPEIKEQVVDSEIFVMEPRGGVVSAISVSGSAREVFRAPSRTMVTADTRARIRAYLQSMPTPPPADSIGSIVRRLDEVIPAWRSMLSDPSGRLWLELSQCPTAVAPTVYEVIDASGRLLGRVTVPNTLRILAVRGERVLVLRRDALGVEHVEMYRIQ